MQFIVCCLAAPENSKLLIEYLNTHEAFVTASKQTLRLAGLKLFFSESFFHVETIQFF